MRRHATLAPEALDGLVQIDEILLGAPTPIDVFDKIAAVMDRILDLRAMVLVTRHDLEAPLTWSAEGHHNDAEVTERVARMALSDAITGDPLSHAPSPESEISGIPERPIAVPVKRSDDGPVLGVLAVDLAQYDNDADHAFLACVASHIGRVLGRADLASSDADALAHRLAELTTLMALRLDDVDASRTARLLARYISSSFGSGCVVDLAHGAVLERVVHAPGWNEALLTRALDPIARAVQRSQEPAAVELGRLLALPTGLPEAVLEAARRELAVEHLVCVPLKAEDDALGTVTILGTSDRGPIPLHLARAVGRRAGVAIANRDRYGKALAALREKDMVLTTVAHDLKSPLGVILMTIYDLLQERAVRGPLDDNDPLELIERAANRMRGLVTGVLELSAIDGYSLAIRPAENNVRALLHEAVDAIAPIARAAGVLVVDETTDVPPLWIDRDRIIQVLTNVLGNAIKFTARGGRITLRTDVVADDLTLTVTDTGCGIAADQLPHVFDRFWRAPGNKKTGSGLGLAICKSIVERSRGRIWIDSTVGEGTSVTIALPLAHEA